MFVGATDGVEYPIKAILAYLSRRSKQPGPLFITKEGIGWTGPKFRAGIKFLIINLKLYKCRHNTHGFWIEAATSASLAKFPDAHIQILGQWRSNAFKRYCNIRPPSNKVAIVSKIIAAGHH